ncbi:MAG: extracellular solute-binding protein, partial [Acidimicrobiia bacterium]
MHSRRYRGPFLLILVLGLLLVGCSSGDDESGSTTTTAATTTTGTESTEATTTTTAPMEPVTITYLASQDWILDGEMALAEQFEAETGIHVDFQIIPSDQYFSVLQTKIEAGGEGIDIFGGQSGKTDLRLTLNVEENAVPLTDEEWVQRMDPLSTEQISLDGVVYGLTLWDTVGGSWVVVYNKQLFADNGISVPATYDEFASACT